MNSWWQRYRAKSSNTLPILVALCSLPLQSVLANESLPLGYFPERDVGSVRIFLKKHPELLQRYPITFSELDSDSGASSWIVTEPEEVLWSPGDDISICFYSKKNDRNALVLSIAREWTKHANISFDAGIDPSRPRLCYKEMAQIRVAYNYPGGSWSKVGREALGVLAPVPTMNLAGFENKSFADEYFRWTILHEFGHVLGLLHEFKNPKGGCEDEYNWEEIISTRGSDFAEKIRSYASQSKILASSYDNYSVMRYYFPENFFIDGRSSNCFGPMVDNFSELDIQAAAHFYPSSQ